MHARHSIPITIAGLLIQVESPLSAAELGIEERLGPFFGAPAGPVPRVTLRWEESEAPPRPNGELIFDPGLVWRMYRSGDAYHAAISYQEGDGTTRERAVLRANAAWDDLTLAEQRVGPDWRSVLALGAGELLLRTSILPAEGLVLHACGLDDNGRGVVFVGHSGEGKSTQAELWSRTPGVIAMADDRTAVRLQAGGATCHGTPWGGTAGIARNHGAPLSAIFVLEQAPENTLQPLAPSAAAPLLLARAFLPFWDRGLMQRALANLDGLLARVPVYRLRCRPEPAVIPLVRSVL